MSIDPIRASLRSMVSSALMIVLSAFCCWKISLGLASVGAQVQLWQRGRAVCRIRQAQE